LPSRAIGSPAPCDDLDRNDPAGLAQDDLESGKYVLGIALWDPATLQPIWSARTESYDGQNGTDEACLLADFVVDTLRQRGVL
jgi:hypothetical protein